MGLFKKKKKIGPKYFKNEAEFARTNWRSLNLDYSVESLKRIDEFLDTASLYPKDRFKDAQFGKTDHVNDAAFTNMSISFGSYFGEVLIKHLNGQWKNSEKLHGWVVDIDGLEVNVIHIAQKCFLEPSKYYASYKVFELESKK